MSKNEKFFHLIDSIKYYSWLVSFMKNLKKIEYVYQSEIEDNKTSVYSVDFYDILVYPFPSINKQRKNESSHDNVLSKLSRSFLFESSDKIKCLLPPYIEEFKSYISYFNDFINNLSRYSILELESLIKIITDNKDNSERVNEYLKLFSDIQRHLLLSLDKDQGIKILEHFLNTKNSNRFYYLDEFGIKDSEILSIIEKQNSDIVNEFNDIRKGYELQNFRDAKAVQFVAELNDRNDKYNHYLVSSAYHTNKYFKKNDSNNNCLSLDFFKTLILISYDISPDNNKHKSLIVERAKEKYTYFENLFGKNLIHFENIITSCRVHKNSLDSCNSVCPNNIRCRELYIQDHFLEIKRLKNETEDISYILKKHGKLPILSKYDEINNLFESKIKNLKEFQLFTSEEQSLDEFKQRNTISEKKLNEYLYKLMANTLPSTKILTAEEVLEQNDFPFYISFKNEALRIIVSNCITQISNKEFINLNASLQQLVSVSVNLDENSEKQKWLVWLVVLFLYRKYRLVINFYEENNNNGYLDSGELKNEFLFLYLKSKWREVVNLSVNFVSNQTIIVKEIRHIVKKIDKSLLHNDVRLMWLKFVIAGLIYEHKEVPDLELNLIEIIGEDYSLKSPNFCLLKRIDEIIEKVEISGENKSLKDRLKMNKAYVLAISGCKHNIIRAQNIMESDFKYPKKPLRTELNYRDTYAFVLFQLALINFKNDNFERLKYAKRAFDYYEQIYNEAKGNKLKFLAKNGMAKCKAVINFNT